MNSILMTTLWVSSKVSYQVVEIYTLHFDRFWVLHMGVFLWTHSGMEELYLCNVVDEENVDEKFIYQQTGHGVCA